MNKIILTSTFVAACGLGALAASAQTPSDVTTTTTVSTAQQGKDTMDTATTVAVRQVPAPGSRNCIQQTGSHIKNTNREQKCLPLNGNSYSREDLERTGDPNLGHALKKLDPQLDGGG